MENPPQETNGIAKPASLAPDDGHARLPDDESQYEEEDGEHKEEEKGDAPYPKRRKSSAVSDMAFAMAATTLLAAMLYTPSCIWVVRHWDDSTAPVAQSTVQRILFVGNLGIDTQIDTEQRSFIVHGITKLRVGARIETRKGTWAYEVRPRQWPVRRPTPRGMTYLRLHLPQPSTSHQTPFHTSPPL